MDYYEAEIYVPVVNVKDTCQNSELTRFRQRLLEKFGGLTDTKHTNDGVWKVGGVEMKDEIVVWRVLFEGSGGLDFISALKSEMEEKLEQEKILIVLREARIL